MHELAIADSIARLAVAGAGGRRVERVGVRIGALRQVVPESLAFAFQVVTHGTALDGCALELQPVPAAVTCRDCGTVSEVAAFPFACGHCGATAVDVVAGEELSLEWLDVIDDDEEERDAPHEDSCRRRCA